MIQRNTPGGTQEKSCLKEINKKKKKKNPSRKPGKFNKSMVAGIRQMKT